jgi:hypothetical protein
MVTAYGRDYTTAHSVIKKKKKVVMMVGIFIENSFSQKQKNKNKYNLDIF